MQNRDLVLESKRERKSACACLHVRVCMRVRVCVCVCGWERCNKVERSLFPFR